MMIPWLGGFVDVVLAGAPEAGQRRMTLNVASLEIISRDDIFRAGALKIARRNPGSALDCSVGSGRAGRRAPARAVVWRRSSWLGYNPVLVLAEALPKGARRRRQTQHAPGRFHSGAQVVKETEQAPMPLADVSWLRIRVRPGQRCRFPIQHQGNPQ